MKKRFLVCILCMTFIFLTACSLQGKAPEIVMDGQQVQLGKTTVGELRDAGFTNRMSYIDSKMIGSMSWENFYAEKDGYSYGTMYAANKKSKEVAFDKGVIIKIFVKYDDPEQETGEVLINGTNFEGYTRDQVKEAMKDLEMTLDYGDYVTFEAGKYTYSFNFADGSETVTQIVLDEGTETEFIVN